MAEKPNTTQSPYAVQARHARQCWKEVRIVAVIWLAALIYCSIAIPVLGYVPVDERPIEPSLLFGIPSWVVWGLFLPWIVLIGATWWFACWQLKDDEPYTELPDSSQLDAKSERTNSSSE